jgi:oxygen-independent coproporphyrinogen-3 oxidase
VEAGDLPVCRGIAVDDDDRLRRRVIERIMCDMAADLDALARASGDPDRDWTPELAALRQLEEDGLIDLDGAVLRVRPESRQLVRVVAAVFDRYLDAADRPDGAPRHAIAV